MLGDAAQLYYTAVFMPNMVINLFSGIIFKPMQTSMAVNYYEKKYKNFWHIIFRMFAIIAGFTLICEVGHIYWEYRFCHGFMVLILRITR